MVSYQDGITLGVPNSSGTEPPRTQAPVNAADCHIHIYDPQLFDLLAIWAPDEATRQAILVRNPEALYGFPQSA